MRYVIIGAMVWVVAGCAPAMASPSEKKPAEPRVLGQQLVMHYGGNSGCSLDAVNQKLAQGWRITTAVPLDGGSMAGKAMELGESGSVFLVLEKP